MIVYELVIFGACDIFAFSSFIIKVSLILWIKVADRRSDLRNDYVGSVDLWQITRALFTRPVSRILMGKHWK